MGVIWYCTLHHQEWYQTMCFGCPSRKAHYDDPAWAPAQCDHFIIENAHSVKGEKKEIKGVKNVD